MLVVDMHDVRGESFFYAGSVDYDEQLGRVWYPIVPIELGDTFEFEVVETDQMTEPIETKKKGLRGSSLPGGWDRDLPLPYWESTASVRGT